METTPATKKLSYHAARQFFDAAMKDASGPDGTYCVSSEKQRVIGRDLLASTGWTLRQLQDAAAAADPLAGEVVHVHVGPQHDTVALARTLASVTRGGGTVRMYPAGPFH
jgi:hypothetical protein